MLNWSGGQQTWPNGDGFDVHPSIPCGGGESARRPESRREGGVVGGLLGGGGDLHITVTSGDMLGVAGRAREEASKEREKEITGKLWRYSPMAGNDFDLMVVVLIKTTASWWRPWLSWLQEGVRCQGRSRRRPGCSCTLQLGHGAHGAWL